MFSIIMINKHHWNLFLNLTKDKFAYRKVDEKFKLYDWPCASIRLLKNVLDSYQIIIKSHNHHHY